MDRSKRLVYPLILVAALLLVPTSAFADLMGPVTITWYLPTLNDPGSIEGGPSAVNPGDSLTCSGQVGTVCQYHPNGAYFDVNIHSLVFWTPAQYWDDWGAGTFDGYVFSNLDFGSGVTLTGITLSVTAISGLDESRVPFGSDYINVDLRGLQTNGEGTEPGTFTLQLHTSDEPSGVPEPGTLSLVFGGLALAGGCHFLRRRA